MIRFWGALSFWLADTAAFSLRPHMVERRVSKLSGICSYNVTNPTTKAPPSCPLINVIAYLLREGNGNPLQHSCLENPMDRGAWWAVVYGVAQSQTRLKRLSMHALEKEMATHSSILAWRIPWTEEPGGLSSMGSHRVRHDWSDLAAAAAAAAAAIIYQRLDL